MRDSCVEKVCLRNEKNTLSPNDEHSENINEKLIKKWYSLCEKVSSSYFNNYSCHRKTNFQFEIIGVSALKIKYKTVCNKTNVHQYCVHLPWEDTTRTNNDEIKNTIEFMLTVEIQTTRNLWWLAFHLYGFMYVVMSTCLQWKFPYFFHCHQIIVVSMCIFKLPIVRLENWVVLKKF